MKNTLSNCLLLISAGLVMNSCSSDSTKMGTTDSDTAVSGNSAITDTSATINSMAADTTAKMTSTPPDKDATDFVMKAASGGMMEVELGKIAQDKAKSQRVKDFGAMMVSDHSAANDDLKSIATSKGLTLPAAVMPDEQKHIDMLKSKSGSDFDKAYTNMMVEDHKKDIAEFKKTADKSTDQDIKNFAAKTLPVLQKHMDSIQAIHNNKM